MSAVVNVVGLIGVEKETLKLAGKILVGSACAAKLQVPIVSATAWFIVTFKFSIVTLLSVDVEAALGSENDVATAPSEIEGIDVPELPPVNRKSKF